MSLKSTVRRNLKMAMITGGLRASMLARRAGLLSSARGRGAIFTLHHVRPKIERGFDPNGHLEITPEFLDAAILTLKRDGYRFVALSDLPSYLGRERPQQPIACFTLDDGYRDNAEFAQPVFTDHRVPFTVFVTEGFIDKTHTMWWETLEALLAKAGVIDFDFGAGPVSIPAGTVREKIEAFDRISAFIMTGDETAAINQLNVVARSHGIDPELIVERLTLRAAELESLVLNPLAELGAHTVSHRALARLAEDEAREELRRSADRVQAITGKRPTCLAYPYGDGHSVSTREHRIARDLGFEIAVTTRPGTLCDGAIAGPTNLPRISLNGSYQKAEYVAALASGIPFRLMGRG
ncbi:polysaccharide deacetylase family protein [Pararhizobium sp.]|uniref:polysaccharide deacetylase family protein n=1 Tax=Pararhizobium sp. TaxID=1977563 RepID=UPI0027171B82|nr:polysaccharide deacetylase family protein [Pararhizobium sp.]MDO9415756.1 polysaccharide deacetylase family protein [Pararhizobium sp.]